MATGAGTIIELRLEAQGFSGQITCPPRLRPAPGQYLVAAVPGELEALPVVLFPSGVVPGPLADTGEAVLSVAPPLPSSWSVSMPLVLRGPLGHGFRMPLTTRRVALAGLENAPFRLLPLVAPALRQRAAVAIYANAIPAGLPEDVEVLPLDLLPEALAWADFLALDADRTNLPGLRSRLGLKPYQHPPCQVQVLVSTAMPCVGLAECGICAIAARDGWALSCTDGPVFDFQQLEG